LGPPKHRKEHKGVNLLKKYKDFNNKEHKGANLFMKTKISTARDQFT